MERAKTTFKKVAKYVPGINLFTGHEYSDPPCFADLEKIINTLCIVSALVLSTVFSLGGSCSYDDLQAADQRYDENEHFAYFVDGFKSYGMEDQPPSAIFVKYLSLSNHIILATLFGLIVLYIYLVAGIDQGTGMEKVQIDIWWHQGGAFLIAIFISELFMGLTFGFQAFGILGWIKYPDRIVYTENYDRTPGDMFTWNSPLNANTAMAVYGMVYPFIIYVILISVLHTNVLIKSKEADGHKKYDYGEIRELVDRHELLEKVLAAIGGNDGHLTKKSVLVELKELKSEIATAISIHRNKRRGQSPDEQWERNGSANTGISATGKALLPLNIEGSVSSHD